MISYKEILESAKRLSSAERLQLASALLTLEEPSAEPMLTESQRQELDSRIEEMDRDISPGIPWEEVMKQIRNARETPNRNASEGSR